MYTVSGSQLVVLPSDQRANCIPLSHRDILSETAGAPHGSSSKLKS